MSYILDALKRADAERGRGAVPGLHTRQLASPSKRDPGEPGAGRALWLGIAAALALAGMGGGLWLWQTPAQAPVAVVAPAVVIAAPVSAAPAPVENARLKAQAEPRRAAPALATPPPVARPPKTVSAQAKPEAKAEPAVTAKASVKASATLTAVPLLSELPDELRRQVPAITITGAVYAANPGQRLLLVNNLVLSQGALAAPELKLEEIQPSSSVFSFRGTRFRVAH
ncbi:MAG: general secretion pathway protein GspB [Gammaproteobacteria bacterium]|uniref:general secretion pathway protein GspB n=1 Tax=Rhodoferax sp. TaxID=50421 RepID=UPI0018568755|nr:general secretion pathway protein GspB [Rhodoferax sp.]MBU3900869.1 general secretion pathway protein GspB [Gammaproteobacteria bacterium]MBA3058659.1 hypothetical protein [Rhodoferax sp.]MBU3998358.1 general secretion pathway protein GspB [Gammaproteobacteria bacterium]MBU4082223.1 general secretion pathway protein GspB [Gammaproteobacteria bacterium]MBU4112773.1 general secretion pathway protein GspB [Gammaproteobacteria bacterium]